MPKPSGARAASPAPPLTNSLPSRSRGKNTYEIILAATGELLAEIGFERLTTNLVCERAGLTPPALYRYFPNKYALLAELARRLMNAQDEVLFAWLKKGGHKVKTLEDAVQKSIRLRKQLMTVTRSQPGGMWILRAIRAVPVLQDVRRESRDKVLQHQFEVLHDIYPEVPEDRLRTALRLSEQTAYAAIEMLVEDPDLDEDRIIEETSWMTSIYFWRLSSRAALNDGKQTAHAPDH